MLSDIYGVFSQDVNTKDDVKMEDVLPGDKAEFCWFVEPWQAAVDIALINTEYSKFIGNIFPIISSWAWEHLCSREG